MFQQYRRSPCAKLHEIAETVTRLFQRFCFGVLFQMCDRCNKTLFHFSFISVLFQSSG